MAKPTKTTVEPAAKTKGVVPSYAPRKHRVELGAPVRDFSGRVVGHQVVDKKTGLWGPMKATPETAKLVKELYGSEGATAQTMAANLAGGDSLVPMKGKKNKQRRD